MVVLVMNVNVQEQVFCAWSVIRAMGHARVMMMDADPKGVKCSADDCEAHYHGSCYSVIQDATRSSAKCLKCKNTFDDYPPTPLGEKAVSSAQDDFSSVQRKRKRPAGRKSRVQEPEEEDELDQVSDEEDDLEYGDP